MYGNMIFLPLSELWRGKNWKWFGHRRIAHKP